MNYEESLAQLKEVLSEKYTFRNATEEELDRLNQLAGGRLTDHMLAFLSAFGLDHGKRALLRDLIEIHGAEDLLKYNTGAVPVYMVHPFGFFCFASFINGDAICVDLEDERHPVYQLSHELINDTDDSDILEIWIDGDIQSFPRNRENALRAACTMARSFEDFIENMSCQRAIAPHDIDYIFDKAKIEFELIKHPGNIRFDIENGVLKKCRASKLVTDITLPDNVNAIGDEAFIYMRFFQTLYIPDGVTEIGSNAFRFCESLNALRLPETVTELPERMCFQCYSLEEITIPASVRSIGHDCFEDCIRLSNVVIPHGVKRIEWGAFSGCKALRSVFVPDTVDSIHDFAFSGCSQLTDFRWEGKVNAVELGINNSDDIINVIDILNRNDLTGKYDLGSKYLVAIGMYRETQCSDAFDFIKKNYIKMARYFIENDCEKNLTLLAQYSEFTSRKRLNDLIKLAEEYHNQKIYELLIGMK